jgi:hypothetical protein
MISFFKTLAYTRTMAQTGNWWQQKICSSLCTHTHTYTWLTKILSEPEFFPDSSVKKWATFLVHLWKIWGLLVSTEVKYVLYMYVPNNWGPYEGLSYTQINAIFKLHSSWFCAQPQSLYSFTAATNPVLQGLLNKHYTSLTLTTCMLYSHNGDAWAI